MDYNSFKEEIVRIIEEYPGVPGRVQVFPVLKNNGKRLDGLCIYQDGQTVSPSIYLNEYYARYQDGAGMEELAEEILRAYTRAEIPEELRERSISEYDKAKDRLAFRLINYEENKELLKSVPHRRVLNLAVVYYVLLRKTEDGIMTALVRNSLMELWGIDQKELDRGALINTPKLHPADFREIGEVMAELWDGDDAPETEDAEPDDFLRMYVLTNSDRNYGAACMLYPNMLEMAADRLGGDILILPSSIHEVIVTPWNRDLSGGELEEMIGDINRTRVASEEVLGGQAYIYRQNSGSLEIYAD